MVMEDRMSLCSQANGQAMPEPFDDSAVEVLISGVSRLAGYVAMFTAVGLLIATLF